MLFVLYLLPGRVSIKQKQTRVLDQFETRWHPETDLQSRRNLLHRMSGCHGNKLLRVGCHGNRRRKQVTEQIRSLYWNTYNYKMHLCQNALYKASNKSAARRLSTITILRPYLTEWVVLTWKRDLNIFKNFCCSFPQTNILCLSTVNHRPTLSQLLFTW